MNERHVRTLFDANRQSPRRCGECTLCCKLLPVVELKKGAGERCRHQRGLGCKVYQQPDKGFPTCCGIWSCRWQLNEEGTENLARPDRSHYVLDVMPDFITITDNATGAVSKLEVLQIWIDPAYPDAHRDPALRAYLEKLAETQPIAAIVRYDSSHALHLMPPALMQDRQWHECTGTATGTHSARDIAEALGHTTRVVLVDE